MVEWAMVEVVRVPTGVCSEVHDEIPLVGKEAMNIKSGRKENVNLAG